MADNGKDIWDKIGSITPLVLGLAVTGVGAFFTHLYDYHQLQLNQIEALDKLRPLLVSDKPEEREFGYASFTALGYEKIAIQIIKLKQDESGRAILVELGKTGSPEIKAQADSALSSLDQARQFVNKAEGVQESYPQQEAWVQGKAKELGVSSPLGLAILLNAAVWTGNGRASTLADTASTVVAPPLNTRDKESAWFTEFLNQHERYLQGIAATRPQFAKPFETRIQFFRARLEAGDWDLKQPDTAQAQTRP